MENRIKELKAGVEMDRASCTSFYANRVPVLLSAAAYAWLHRSCGGGHTWETRFARTQAEGLRLCLLKLVGVEEFDAAGDVASLPREAPYVSEWRQIARSLAQGGADLGGPVGIDGDGRLVGTQRRECP